MVLQAPDPDPQFAALAKLYGDSHVFYHVRTPPGGNAGANVTVLHAKGSAQSTADLTALPVRCSLSCLREPPFGETLEGSFSAVSTPIFATKYSNI